MTATSTLTLAATAHGAAYLKFDGIMAQQQVGSWTIDGILHDNGSTSSHVQQAGVFVNVEGQWLGPIGLDGISRDASGEDNACLAENPAEALGYCIMLAQSAPDEVLGYAVMLADSPQDSDIAYGVMLSKAPPEEARGYAVMLADIAPAQQRQLDAAASAMGLQRCIGMRDANSRQGTKVDPSESWYAPRTPSMEEIPFSFQSQGEGFTLIEMVIVVCLDGDVDRNGHTGMSDLLQVLSDWGDVDSNTDLDLSGAVDVGDLIDVLQHFGTDHASIEPNPSP